MKQSQKQQSWLERKLKNQKFSNAFQKEYQKLSIGEQLAHLRQSARLTQVELARKVGTTASAISRYENAEYERYELQTLQKIAKACGSELLIMFRQVERNKDAA